MGSTVREGNEAVAGVSYNVKCDARQRETPFCAERELIEGCGSPQRDVAAETWQL